MSFKWLVSAIVVPLAGYKNLRVGVAGRRSATKNRRGSHAVHPPLMRCSRSAGRTRMSRPGSRTTGSLPASTQLLTVQIEQAQCVATAWRVRSAVDWPCSAPCELPLFPRARGTTVPSSLPRRNSSHLPTRPTRRAWFLAEQCDPDQPSGNVWPQQHHFLPVPTPHNPAGLLRDLVQGAQVRDGFGLSLRHPCDLADRVAHRHLVVGDARREDGREIAARVWGVLAAEVGQG
jgi:hypothetical protein